LLWFVLENIIEKCKIVTVRLGNKIEKCVVVTVRFLENKIGKCIVVKVRFGKQNRKIYSC
jgi:hypothetical protein